MSLCPGCGEEISREYATCVDCERHPGWTSGREPTQIRCTGRAVGVRDAQPYGPECGRVYSGRGHRTDAERRDGARAAGWRIGHLPDGELTATCPTCSKPDPATGTAVREITATLKGTTER